MKILIPFYGKDFEDVRTLELAIKHFGKERQQTVLIEEMAELIQQLSKLIIGHPNKSREKLVEEYSDVLVMLCQLEYIYDIQPEEVTPIQRCKLNRIKELMEIR